MVSFVSMNTSQRQDDAASSLTQDELDRQTGLHDGRAHTCEEYGEVKDFNAFLDWLGVVVQPETHN